MKRKVGVVGVGAMGKGMAGCLLKAGYHTTVFDKNPEAVKALAAQGAKAAASPKEVGEASEVVVTSLPNPEAFEEVMLAGDGLLKGLKPGGYVIDMSTIDPGTTRKVHEIAAKQGVRTLDGPVSGGPQGAAAGTLAVMVGGDPADYAAVKEILDILGQKVFHVGPIGAGQTVKVCNNALAAVHTVALGEVLLTGVKSGVDLQVLTDVIRSASGNCWILENFFPKTVLVKHYDPPLFALNLMVKDLGLYLRTAEAQGVPSVMSSLAFQMYRAAKATGKGLEDHTGVVRMAEELAGAEIGTVKK